MDLPKKWFDEELWPEFENAFLQGRCKHYFTFLRKLKGMPPSTVRNFVRRNKWTERFKKLQEQVEANLAALQSDDVQVQLYKDQRRASEMRSTVLDQMEKALEGKTPKDGLATRELKTIADALHVLEADLRESQKSLDVEGGDPVVRVIVTNETAPFAKEYPARKISPNGNDPVAGGSPQPSSEGENSLGRTRNLEDGLRHEVVNVGSSEKSVTGRGGVHQPVVQTGEKKHLGEVEQLSGASTDQNKSGGKLPGSCDQIDRREGDHSSGDGQLRRAAGNPSSGGLQRREGVLTNTGVQ